MPPIYFKISKTLSNYASYIYRIVDCLPKYNIGYFIRNRLFQPILKLLVNFHSLKVFLSLVMRCVKKKKEETMFGDWVRGRVVPFCSQQPRGSVS